MTYKPNSEGYEGINYLTMEYPTMHDIYKIKAPVKVKVSSPEAAHKLFKISMAGLDQEREHFLCASVDTNNTVKSVDIISIGSLNANIVHPREVYYTAIANRAAAIIIGHNHPSGNTAPSQNDIDLTSKLVEVGSFLGIKILDHIISGPGDFDGYYSMKEQSVGGLVK